jgi:outer membrane immunogenic protein
MKKFLLGSVALAALGIGAPAIAADMGVRPVAAAPVFSWTGCHLGGLVGYGWGHDNGYNTTAASSFVLFGSTPGARLGTPPVVTPAVAGQSYSPEFDMSGFNGGGYAGCDYQFGSIVVGAEGDWSVVNKSGQSQVGQGRPIALTTGAVVTLAPGALLFTEAQERWYATARARVGYAVDKWLFFVSGGAAWTKVDSSIFQTNAPVPSFFALSSDKRTGWTVGAGVDYAPTVLKGHWMLRAEYLYVHFDDFTTFGNPVIAGFIPGATTGYFTNLNTRFDNHVVRFGLAYKFL